MKEIKSWDDDVGSAIASEAGVCEQAFYEAIQRWKEAKNKASDTLSKRANYISVYASIAALKV